MALVSGIWPYTKQLITLTLWFAPPRFVGIAKRGKVFLWLDVLAKWSFVDVFVMICTVIGFSVHIISPQKQWLPTELYEARLIVVPVWGLYANMFAQILSQLTSHFIIGYHRRVENIARIVLGYSQLVDSGAGLKSGETSIKSGDNGLDVEDPVHDDVEGRTHVGDLSQTQILPPPETWKDEAESSRNAKNTPTFDNWVMPATYEESHIEKSRDSEEVYALNRHEFSRTHREKSEKLRIKVGVNVLVAVVALFVVALVVAGCIIPAFSFDYQGLIGLAVEFGNNSKQTQVELSLFSLVASLMNQARFLNTVKDSVGMLSVSIVFVLSVLLAPIALTCVLVVVWFVPVRRDMRLRLRTTIEVFAAWQYIEVFVLSAVVSAWQIGNISSFLVNDYCDSLKGSFATLVSYGFLSADDAQCFRVVAKVENGSYILIAASFLLIMLSLFVTRALAQCLREFDDKVATNEISHSCTLKDDPLPVEQKITPAPVQFTDNFRWLLTSKP
jgi:hypothetical protein